MDVRRKTAEDFHPEVLKLFDKYVHGDISRRGFLQSVAQFAGGVTALSLLDALNPRFADAYQGASNDSRMYDKLCGISFATGLREIARLSDAACQSQG